MDEGNCMLNIILEGEIRDKLVVPKGGAVQLQYLRPNVVCTVPEELRKPGFPLNEGEKMRRAG